MQIIKNAGAPAPPPSANQPVIIQEKKSNTTCIVITTVVCLCIVAPIIIVIAMMASAAAVVTSAIDQITIPETTTTPPYTPIPSVPQFFMDICQPGNPVEVLSGGETWTADDLAHPNADMANSPEDVANVFNLHTSNYFDGNGDFVFYDYLNGPAGQLPLSGPTSCTFKITPADPAQNIMIHGFPNIGSDIHSDKQITDLSTDMTNCGNTYLSINGVRKCGTVTMGAEDPYEPMVFNAGESVEFILEAADNAKVDFGTMGFYIRTGTDLTWP